MLCISQSDCRQCPLHQRYSVSMFILVQTLCDEFPAIITAVGKGHGLTRRQILAIVVGGIQGIISTTDDIVCLIWEPHAEHAHARVTASIAPL